MGGTNLTCFPVSRVYFFAGGRAKVYSQTVWGHGRVYPLEPPLLLDNLLASMNIVVGKSSAIGISELVPLMQALKLSWLPLFVGRGDALVERMTFNRGVVGSPPALSAT